MTRLHPSCVAYLDVQPQIFELCSFWLCIYILGSHYFFSLSSFLFYLLLLLFRLVLGIASYILVVNAFTLSSCSYSMYFSLLLFLFLQCTTIFHSFFSLLLHVFFLLLFLFLRCTTIFSWENTGHPVKERQKIKKLELEIEKREIIGNNPTF